MKYCIVVNENSVPIPGNLKGLKKGDFPWQLISNELGCPITSDDPDKLDDICGRHLKDNPHDVLAVRELLEMPRFEFEEVNHGRYKLGEAVATYSMDYES